MRDKRTCKICNRKMEYAILFCEDCTTLKNAFYRYTDSVKKDRKKLTDAEVKDAVRKMTTNLQETGNKILKEWSIE